MTGWRPAKVGARDRAIELVSRPLSSRLVVDDSFQSSAFERMANQAEVVSFDVFDTVLVRPLARPVDLFLLLGDALSCDPADARSHRVDAEAAAVSAAGDARRGEIRLHEIHERLASRLGTDPDESAAREVELERLACRRHEPAHDLWTRLVANGTRVVFTSDTYLPSEFITELLVAAGYGSNPECVVSSAELTTKRAGGLFDVLLDRVGVSPGEVLHLGDTLTPDVARPLLRRMRAGYVARPIDQLRRACPEIHAGAQRASGAETLVASWVAGTLANRMASVDRRGRLPVVVQDLRTELEETKGGISPVSFLSKIAEMTGGDVSRTCLAELDTIVGSQSDARRLG